MSIPPKYRVDPALVAAFAAMPPPTGPTDVAASRARLAGLKHLQAPADPTGLTITDQIVGPDVSVRVYQPEGRTGLPGILAMHPGGFTIGDLDTNDGLHADLAREVEAVVVSVDYRLSPENRFPAAIEDCHAALVWLAEHPAVDPTRIALHGISAGGGLAAGLALLARDCGGPAIAFQYLNTPEIDDRLTTRSMVEFVDTPMFSRENAIRSWDAYLGPGVRGGDAVSPYAAPSRCTDLEGLPPAYIAVMEHDPLRDEAIAYAQALLAAGVQVELHLFPGTFHGSSAIAPTAEVTVREHRERIAVLRRALN
ncbi:alpha/beta hydrolase [Kutzneria kofuensis]|uniref:Acetyl esterase/lipase n=1 Tax=Kutzneria kofuensis TaxID=103725 RepID=A0A7W9KQG4_9PSEU|nr:alpha/beta hydrolase [Kutzneria kofuensis]MBB5896538.1 acetyl esterase/lipase [Kutzneria kofuensis]